MQWSAALDDHQVLGVMSNEGRGLLRGLYWAEMTRHGVIDIDQGSRYHNKEALTKLLQDFSLLGLPLVPYQSSDSGGWHLYLFFEEFADSAEVENSLRTWLKFKGYDIKGGTLEIFPSGNALRLPLQKGFAWLDLDGQIEITRDEITQEQALASFFVDLENNKRNWSEAKSRIESQINSAGSAGDAGAQGNEKPQANEGFEKLYLKGIDWEKWQRGREYWRDGLTEKSQRHDATICIGHYLWYGDEAAGLAPLPYKRNKERREALINEWLKDKHNGLSEDVNRGRWSEVEADVKRATSWTNQMPQMVDYEPYPLTDRLVARLKWLYDKTGKLWTIEELAKANIDRSLDARNRIALAIVQLEAEGSEIDVSKVARRAKSCHKTVAKNIDLLCSPGGVLIAGGGGGTLGSLSGSCPDNQLRLLFSQGGLGRVNPPATEKEEERFLSVLPEGDSGALEVVTEVPAHCRASVAMTETWEELAACVAGEFSIEFLALVTEPSFRERLGVSEVAPLLSCLAKSQPESPQSQAQALRVPAANLTPGPRLSGIQALRHEAAGGFYLVSQDRSGAGVSEAAEIEQRQVSGMESRGPP